MATNKPKPTDVHPGGNVGGIMTTRQTGVNPGTPAHQGVTKPNTSNGGDRSPSESRGQATHQDLNLDSFRGRNSNTTSNQAKPGRKPGT